MEKDIIKLTRALARALTTELTLRQQETDVKIALKVAHTYTLLVEDELRQFKQDMLQFEHGRTATIEGQTEENKTSEALQTPERGRWFDAESWEAQKSVLNLGGADGSNAPHGIKKRIGKTKI